MTSFAALTAAALLAGLSAPPVGLPAATGDVTFEAKQVVFHGETGTYELTGGAVVRRGGVVLRGDRATLNPTSGEVWASGDVLLVDATRAVRAETMHAVLDGPFEATEVIAFLKESPLEPVRITSMAEAREGRNRLSLFAERVDGDAEGRLAIQGARFTLCDCGVGKAPTWELTAPRAKVEGDRLSLSWPTLRVTPRIVGVKQPVPVLILPWLSLPLRDRQSGLLFPVLASDSVTGFEVGVPLYLTLGRSADLTATPEYFFGPKHPEGPGGAVKGPGLGLEVRWAPAERAFGEVRFNLVLDELREHMRDPDGDGPLQPEPAAGGLRLSIEGVHRQSLGPATRLAAHASLSQDAFMFRDFRGMGLPENPYYSRSDVLVSHRSERWVLEGGAAYYEPLAHDDLFRPGPPSWFGLSLPTLQRWPSASARLLPSGDGLALEGRVGITRFAPFVGHEGQLLPTDPGFPRTDSQNPARPQLPAGQVPLPREAVTRGEARLQLSLPALFERTVSVEPWVRGSATGYAFDAVDPTAAAWGVVGISASAELARRYGNVEHRITPRLELLGGTAAWRPASATAFPAYDLWDRVDFEEAAELEPSIIVQQLSAAPSGAYSQARLTLGNGLTGPHGSLGLTLGQDVDLRAGRLAESFASLTAVSGLFRADGSVRVLAFGGRPPLTETWRRSWLDEFTRLHLGASLRDRRGDALRASIDATGAGAVGAQGAGVDALFDLRPSGAPPDAWYRAGARLVLGGASLDYEVRLTAREYPHYSCKSGESRGTLEAGRIAEQTATFGWDSPCKCFTLRVRASRDACDVMSYGLDVDLSKMLQGAATKRP